MLLKSIVDNSLPRLLYYDIPILNNILKDIFPDIKTPSLSNAQYKLKQVLEMRLYKKHMTCTEVILQDILNLYEAINQRTGTVIVGLPMAGKTTMIKTLTECLQ